ncbi:exodeoxyribonuclease V subunit gamma [Candidatus Fukatsuia anoeciicola]|uniref:exodeoxyribonuclease V subunit gamma n=1 Tax=Candidatus Fukatsuia anoeciicola TaxID=2994492 RepID=UPI003463A45D
MFTIYYSNQLDILKELTAIIMERNPLKNPFQQEVILVQSSGMAQWLQIQLAQKLGIAANIQFPLPAAFIWDTFTKVLPNIPKESAFSKQAMKWKLMWLLPTLLENPIFTEIKHYLGDNNEKKKIYQLATRIADLFDQYLVYRPEWLKKWENGQLIDGLGNAQQWQALLWAELIQYTHQLKQSKWHRANLYQHFIYRLHENNICLSSLPKRVFICGISALPPIYLQVLQALGKHIEIHLMFTNPCRYFWSDIQDYTFLAKLENRKRRYFQGSLLPNLFRNPQLINKLFNTEGQQNLSNPLLASWGRLGRDYIYLLSQFDDTQEVHAFVDIEPNNLLHTIQNNILELENHTVIGVNEKTFTHSNQKQLLDLQDYSISIHVCHSPQREIEVLQDYILDLLSVNEQLTIRDIIVMVADIDNYTPYIQAVFSNATAERYLPFTISDRKSSQVHPILQTFITLLNLPQSRFTSEEVLALLEIDSLAKKFGIDKSELRYLRQWVKEVGIRWGLDDDNVRQFSLPPTGQHTWKFGLTRMLLGYAMDSKAGDWQGILPYDESSGLAAELVGRLAEMIMQLSLWRQQLINIRTLAEWLPICQQLLNAFFERSEDNEEILALIEQQWQKIINYGEAAQYPDNIPITLLRDDLISYFNNEKISQRFLAGSINFCTLMPMRSIPFKIICLLGMNDGNYPRTVPPLGFDLMAQQAQRGDRNRRDDDRYLFLEALISAQQQLYISYIGNSIQDNSKCYPSVLVSELLNYLIQSYYIPGDGNLNADDSAKRVAQHIVRQHTCNPFTIDNFIINCKQQSYAVEWLPAAQAHGQIYPNFSCPLVTKPLTKLTLDDLIRFYRHPVRAFFQLRLGVNFVIKETELSTEEPFILDNLARYQFNTLFLNTLIEQEDINKFIARSKASGTLPYSSFGEIYWQSQQKEIASLAKQIRSERSKYHSIELDIKLGETKLVGWLHRVQTDGLLRWRPTKLTAMDGMLLWLEHLVYCLAGGNNESRIYGCKGTMWRFKSLLQSDAQHYLQLLYTGYQRGMSQPLLLLYKSGWSWLINCFHTETGQICWNEKTQTKAKEKLLQTWQGNLQQNTGEKKDFYIQRILQIIDDKYLQIILQEAERYLLPIARHGLIKC